MCALVVKTVDVEGSGKGGQGWFQVTRAVVDYDHPTHAMLEQSVNIDLVNDSLGPSARVAVELTAQSARALAYAILAVVDSV